MTGAAAAMEPNAGESSRAGTLRGAKAEVDEWRGGGKAGARCEEGGAEARECFFIRSSFGIDVVLISRLTVWKQRGHKGRTMLHLMEFLRKVNQECWTAGVLGATACGLTAFMVLKLKFSKSREAKEKIQRARDQRDESLHQAEQMVIYYKQSGMLERFTTKPFNEYIKLFTAFQHQTVNSTSIMSLSLSELTQQLQSGSLDPSDVFHCFLEKTLAVHKKLNCCTEILLESVDQLKTLDPNKKGLLYGVPISIKDNVAYKNHDCSCGVVSNLDQPAKEDGVIVQVLKKQGAIPFVKTNIPQSLLSYDCSNVIYGQTVNPHNSQKTSGGSSGGEGALIGAGGSLLGVGSDIAGSIRIPASFCGICGFKPTVGRLSTQGIIPIYRGQKSVLSCPGPMAKDVDSLALFMQAVLCDDMFSLDPTVPPLPFSVEIYQSSRPLRIGYLENDGYMHPSPSMARGIREVKALLKQAGHTLVSYQPLRIQEAVTELLMKAVFADTCASLLQKLKGEEIDPCLRSQIFIYRFPKWLKKVLAFVLKPVSSHHSAVFDGLSGVGTIQNLWKQHAAVEDYIRETIAHWRSCKIDVLLCPMIGPAYNFLYCGRISTVVSYTMLYNLLTFPAGTVTVSTVTAEDEEQLKGDKGAYQDRGNRLFKEAVSGGVGLPVAVQCVALPWQDELCLRFMKEVEQLTKQSKKLA
ncbi:vitamin D3 hydroxylase-associated protein-like [Pholidichthys leucotaenia]